MVKDSSLFRDVLYYSSSHYFRQLLNVITAFVRPALLSPQLFGLWSLFKVIETYADYLHMGSFSSMRYQIPYHDAKREYSTIHAIKGSVFYGSLYLYLLFSGVLLCFSLLPGISPEARAGFVAFAIILLLIWYNNYHMALLKAYGKFSAISKLNYIYYLAVFILNIVLIYFWGIYGAYLSILLPLLAVDLILKKKFGLGELAPPQRKVFFKLTRDGFPIMLYNTAAFFIRTSDRFIVAIFLGTQQLGYYAIAILVLGFLLNIPGAARDVLDPHMMKESSQKSVEEIADKYFIKPLMNTAYFMPLVIGGAYFCLPDVITLILPQYTDGILPAQIMIVGGYFIGLSYTARGIIVANKWQAQAPLVMLFPLLINIVLSLVLIKAGFGITGVAVASTFSYFILAASLLSFVSAKEKFIARLLASHMRYLCLPLPVLGCSIYLLEKGLRLPILHPYCLTMIKLMAFTAIFSLFIFFTKERHTLIQKLNYERILRRIL